MMTFTKLRNVISTAFQASSRNLTVASAQSVAVVRSAVVPLTCGGTAAAPLSSVRAQRNNFSTGTKNMVGIRLDVQQNETASYSSTRAQGINFSTGTKKIVDIRRDEQRNIWDAYLLGSISADSVFRSLDLNKSGIINVEEINYFMESVHKAGVSEEAFDLLQKLGEDHALDAEEFERWLCMGTELRRVNPALEGILDNLDDSSSSDSSDDEEDSTATSAPSKMVDARRGLQQLVWETFLSTGEHGTDLFKMMDLNRNGRISVDEITYFIDSIGAEGVDVAKFDKLKALGEDHELNNKEFISWLTSATGIDPAGGDIGGGPVEDAGGEHSPVRDN